jgi:hypothetical protein
VTRGQRDGSLRLSRPDPLRRGRVASISACCVQSELPATWSHIPRGEYRHFMTEISNITLQEDLLSIHLNSIFSLLWGGGRSCSVR